MTKVVNLKAYQQQRIITSDRIKHIRETVLRVTGRRLTDDEIFDIYGGTELSWREYVKKNLT